MKLTSYLSIFVLLFCFVLLSCAPQKEEFDVEKVLSADLPSINVPPAK